MQVALGLYNETLSQPPSQKRCLTFLRLGFLVVCKLAVKAASETGLQCSSLSIGTHAHACAEPQPRCKVRTRSQEPEALSLFVLLILAFVYVCHMCAQFPWRSLEGIRYNRTRLPDRTGLPVVSVRCGCWEWNPGPL